MLLAKLLVVGLLAADETPGSGPAPVAAGARERIRLRSSTGAAAVIANAGGHQLGGPGLTTEIGGTTDRLAVTMRFTVATVIETIHCQFGPALDWIVRDDLSIGIGVAGLLFAGLGYSAQSLPLSAGIVFPVRLSLAPPVRPADQVSRRGLVFSFELAPGVSAYGFAIGGGFFISYAVW